LLVYAGSLIVDGMPLDRAIRLAMVEPLTDDVTVRAGLLDLVRITLG
jgi:nitric oxide reductase NorQ protein